MCIVPVVKPARFPFNSIVKLGVFIILHAWAWTRWRTLNYSNAVSLERWGRDREGKTYGHLEQTTQHIKTYRNDSRYLCTPTQIRLYH